MEINSDFSLRVAVHAGSLPWVPSPLPGVQRRMLDRIGDEVARATSIVRYAPSSHFSAHVHGGGEEFFVLEGVFQDEHGDYPVGTYVRNPPQSSHTPRSEPGCVIFVKLWQFDPQDRATVVVDSRQPMPAPIVARSGVVLHSDAREQVRLEFWSANAEIPLVAKEGLELLVLEGSFTEGGECFVAQSWLRLPHGYVTSAQVSGQGCRVWVKTGKLIINTVLLSE